jgi:hypothetical protein
MGKDLKYQVSTRRVAHQLDILWFDTKALDVIDGSYRLFELKRESGYGDESFMG